MQIVCGWKTASGVECWAMDEYCRPVHEYSIHALKQYAPRDLIILINFEFTSV
jgi:hypothetical protein